MHIAISGELGSGKSTVAALLAAGLDAEVVSTGAIHRAIAADRGISALETNLVAESDEEIDARIDGELVRRGGEADPIVFDSRMAWHFVPTALKVHLVVDRAVAAARMLGRSPTAVEQYDSIEDAATRADERHASEQRRFLGKYGVDIDRLRNYDVVVDTSEATPEQVAAQVRAFHEDLARASDGPAVCLSPRRLLPDAAASRTEDGAARPDADVAPDAGGTPVATVAYSRPWFAVVDGHDAVRAAADAGAPLLRVALRAEDGEEVAPGTTATDLVQSVRS